MSLSSQMAGQDQRYKFIKAGIITCMKERSAVACPRHWSCRYISESLARPKTGRLHSRVAWEWIILKAAHAHGSATVFAASNVHAQGRLDEVGLAASDSTSL